ncbi:MAG: hypothetical protein SGJ27_19110 [Candidatus Melainabacteria bacterium]|nr:hypothetical protein [Candidatus Melainabacteria bacterium]
MIANFEQLIQTDAGCEELLFELRFGQNCFKCECGCTKAYKILTRKFLYECANQECKKQISLTAGTFFHGKKLAISTCFKLVVDIISGREIAGAAHAAELDVGASTIWRWRHELRLVLEKTFPLGDNLKVDRNLLNRVLFRRSVESPAKNINDKVPGSGFNENQVEPRSQAESRAVADANRFVSKTYKGVSGKYSQLYLAEYRFLLSAKMQDKTTLLKSIVRAGPVSIKDIVSYSSPKFVNLPLVRMVS